MLSDENGQAQLSVDTAVLSVSRAIEEISRAAEITDLSVEGTSADELAVSLYREFEL